MNNISPKGKDKHPGSTICGYFSLCCSFCFYALIPLNAHGLLPKSHMSSQTGFNICLTIWGIGFILALVASRASKALVICGDSAGIKCRLCAVRHERLSKSSHRKGRGAGSKRFPAAFHTSA